MTSSGDSTVPSRVPALDGIRGLAIAMVLAGHFGILPGGGWGVDLFFVLSGYLITGLLLGEHAKTGRIHLGKFYMRRIRRLAPALAVLLIFAVPEILLIEPNDGNKAINLVFVVSAVGYVSNWVLTAVPHPSDISFGYLWSLSVEEQFYLVWPALLGLLTLTVRRRWIVALLLVVVVLEPTYRLYLLSHGASWERLYAGSDTHADPIILGCLVALASHWYPRFRQVVRRWAQPLVLAGLLGLLAFTLWFAALVPLYAVQASITAIGGGLILAGAPLLERGPALRFLSWSPLRRLGLISYSAYLWNVPVMIFLTHLPVQPPTLLRAALGIGLTLLMAEASYQLVESRFRHKKNPGPRRSESRSSMKGAVESY